MPIASAASVAAPPSMAESPRNTEGPPDLQCSLSTTFVLAPYEPGLRSGCDLRLRPASSVSPGLPGLLQAEPGALQLNPSIIQTGTPGSAGEHTFVSNQAIKSKTHFSVTAYSPELQQGEHEHGCSCITANLNESRQGRSLLTPLEIQS